MGTAAAPPPRRAPLFRGSWLLGAGASLQKEPIGTFFEATAACGDVARLWFPLPPFVGHILRHPDAIAHVLVDNAKNYGKQTQVYDKLRDVLGNGLVTSEGDFWRRQRRIANPAFHRERIAHFGNVMVRCTRELIERWQPRMVSGAPFDFAQEAMHLTLRIIDITMLSSDLEAEAAVVARALDDVQHSTIARAFRPIDPPTFVPTPTNLRLKKGRAILNRIVNRAIAERRRKPGVSTGADGESDLLDMLIDARDPDTGEGMSDAQLRDEVMTIFLAGHETTANALGWTLYLLSRHPSVARQLRGEVREVLGDRDATLADLPNLPLTDRVIKESMRILPPVWSMGRSAVADDVIDGFVIPKGSWIFVSAYLTQRDPRFWPNPEGFDPDRFLPEAEAARPKGAYFPFAFGPRKCIGETFALMEARLILATLMQRTELALVPGYRLELDPTITLRPKHGIWMTARPPQP